jgi:hypothetical protein
MTSRLASLLVQDGLISTKKMAEAFQRQVIYGGTLDTILLEMDAISEGVLLDALARSSLLPAAGDLPSVTELQGTEVTQRMPHSIAERYRAVPVALEGNSLRVLVIDPPDRKHLDELGYMLSLMIDPIIVPEHRFVQAVELVYGVAVPARFAALAAKLRQRATDPKRLRALTPEPILVPAPTRELIPETPSQRLRMRRATPAPATTPRAVVTDVPMPAASAPPPAAIPAFELKETSTPRQTSREAAAPSPVTSEVATRVVGEPQSAATPLDADDARDAIEAAADRDAIFEALCRGARAHVPFAAILTVHGEVTAGRLALGDGWLDRNLVAAVAVPLDKPSPFRAAAVGRAPYLGRIGDDSAGLQMLASLQRNPPLPALLMPIVLRERAVALLYADAAGQELEATVVAELSALTATAARSFQRLILRAKAGEYAKAPGSAAGKLGATSAGESGAAEGEWRRPDAPQTTHETTYETTADEPRRTTQPRFSNAILNAIRSEQPPRAPAPAPGPPEAPPSAAPRAAATPATAVASTATPPSPAPAGMTLADIDALVASVVRGDADARMSGDALVAFGERAALAVVAALPGPLRLDRHDLRGQTPPLSEHGPLLAVLSRLGRLALPPLLHRLSDPSLEVRYYATLAVGELKLPEVAPALGARLYDADSGVRRAAIDSLARFSDSRELRVLTEQLRAELLGPDPVRQRCAAEALGALRDVASIPRLIELVKHPDPTLVSVARRALVEITKQDFGTSRWRWRGWWERHRDQPRIEWMLEGLGHAEAEVRLSASEELRGMTNEYFGYAFDLPKREREDARKRWVDWFRAHGNKFQDRR